MTTTARQATSTIAASTTTLAQLVILAAIADEFDTCALCSNPAAELYTRIDNRDGAEIECCEHCADTADVSYCAE